jgi:cytidylate kinase
MREKHFARSLAESIVHANSYRESHQQAGNSANAPLTIAISRQAGAGGTSVAMEVGSRLGWPVYDHALVERIAREMHLRTQLLESVDERRKSWMLECAEAFGQAPPLSESAYVRHLIETVISLGAHGSCIIVGRGAAHILAPPMTLRVRLVAAREDRVNGLAREKGLSHEDAERRVDEIERERTAFIKDHFQVDIRNAELYDLVLNTSRFSYPECADLIVESLRRLESHAKAYVAEALSL